MKKLQMMFYCHVKDGDDIWFSFQEINAIGKYNCRTKQGALVKVLPKSKSFSDLHSAMAAYGNQIICLPALDDKVTIFDKSSEEIIMVPLPFLQNSERLCSCVSTESQAYIFSNISSDPVLCFDFQKKSFAINEPLTATFTSLFKGDEDRRFAVKEYEGDLVVLNQQSKKLFLLDNSGSQIDCFSLDRIPYSILDVFFIDQSIWILTRESTSIFELQLFDHNSIVEYPSDSCTYLFDHITVGPYSSVVKWGDRFLALSQFKKNLSVISDGKVVDLKDNSTYETGILGYGHGGMYTSSIPYEDQLMVLNYKSSHILYIDSSMQIVNQVPSDIEISDDLWKQLSESVFSSGCVNTETSYLHLTDLLKNL